MNTERIDIMVDLETLSTEENPTVFQIAACTFDIETGEILSSFEKTADISCSNSLNVSGNTLKWWLNTNKDLLANLINNGEGSEEEMFRSFHSWLYTNIPQTPTDNGFKNMYLWGNGILFDNRIIQQKFKSFGLCHPILYRNDRDVRTIVELALPLSVFKTENEMKSHFSKPDYTAHNALDDVKFQIDLVCYCYRLISRKENEIKYSESISYDPVLNFSFKYGNIEIRTCNNHLMQQPVSQEDVTAEIVYWFQEKHCYTIAYWKKDNEGYFLQYVGNRMFEEINIKDYSELYLIMKKAQEELDKWCKQINYNL